MENPEYLYRVGRMKSVYLIFPPGYLNKDITNGKRNFGGSHITVVIAMMQGRFRQGRRVPGYLPS